MNNVTLGQIAPSIASPATENVAKGTTQTKTAAPLLGGENVTVTTAYTDLEKLVARLKNENEDQRASLAQLRLAVVTDVLASLSEEQAEALAKASGLETELGNAKAESLVVQAEIERLEKAVQQNIEDGKIHRKQVQELKELREKQAEKLAALEAAQPPDAAAISAAKQALSATDAAIRIASAKAAAADASLEKNRASLEGAQALGKKSSERVAGLEKALSEAYGALDQNTVGKLAAALRAATKAETASEGPEAAESPAEARKRELKAEQADPANAIRDALDRIAGLLEDIRTIEENKPVVG